MDIRFHENISLSPAWLTVPAYMVELQRQGYAETPQHGPAWNDAALVMYDTFGAAVGWLAYRYGQESGSWWIIAAYVEPIHRLCGIHSALFTALVERAKGAGILTINSGVHKDNTASQRAMQRQGRELVGYQYRYTVKPWNEGVKLGLDKEPLRSPWDSGDRQYGGSA